MLRRACRIVVCAWVAAQIAVVAWACSTTPASDSAYYLRLARECAAACAWYPLPVHTVAEPYVANPGYINLLWPVVALGGPVAGLLLNVAMNCALLWVLHSLVRRLCGRRTAEIFTMLWCVLPSNTVIVGSYMSELPCALAGCAALRLLCGNPRAWRYALAGVLLVVCHWMRPAAVVYAAPAVVWLLWRHASAARWTTIAAGMLAAAIALGAVNYAATGRLWLFATTGGCNLIQGASDEATGGYQADVFAPGHAGDFAPEEAPDVWAADSLWRARALQWIAHHPAQFAALAQRKVYMQMFADSNHLHLHAATAAMNPRPVMIAESVPYYAMLLLAAAGALLLARRRCWWLLALLASPWAVNLLMAAAIVGAPRYHYPAMPALVLAAALALRLIFVKRAVCR